MPDFGERLSLLVSSELPHARRDVHRLSLMIERLSAALGLVIAVGARGNVTDAETLAEGSRHYIDQEIVEKLKVGRLLG